jgi:hypothetical protein
MIPKPNPRERLDFIHRRAEDRPFSVDIEDLPNLSHCQWYSTPAAIIFIRITKAVTPALGLPIMSATYPLSSLSDSDIEITASEPLQPESRRSQVPPHHSGWSRLLVSLSPPLASNRSESPNECKGLQFPLHQRSPLVVLVLVTNST